MLRPRVLVDVSSIDMSTTILGYKISAPIMIAPTGFHQLPHPEGEVATARAAASSNTIMILSYSSTCTVEEVASSCNAIGFFQLYVNRRRDISAQLVQRAERNGYEAIVLTVDVPRMGRREADIKNKMVSPQLKNFEGLISTAVNSDEGSNLEAFVREAIDDSLCWEIGRPVIYGLAANGEDGVRKVMKMLSDELELTMALYLWLFKCSGHHQEPC